MSRDVGQTTEDGDRRAVTFTSFWGGTDNGRCLQMTQMHRRDGDMDRFNAVQMTEQQVREAVQMMMDWLES